MPKHKRRFSLKTPILVSLAIAIVGTIGLVGLANRKESVIEFPSAATTPADVNLLRNPSFETDSNNDKFPDNWSRSDNITREDVITHTESYQGRNSLKLVLGKRKFYTQTFTGNWPKGTYFNFHAYSKGMKYLDGGHQAFFEVAFTFKDNPTDLFVTNVSLPPGNHEWKDNSGSWTNDREYPVTKVRVRVGSDRAEKGDLYFDNVSVFAMVPTATPTGMLTPTPTRRPSPTPTRASCVVCDPLPGCYFTQVTCTTCGPMVCTSSPTPTITY